MQQYGTDSMKAGSSEHVEGFVYVGLWLIETIASTPPFTAPNLNTSLALKWLSQIKAGPLMRFVTFLSLLWCCFWIV